MRHALIALLLLTSTLAARDLHVAPDPLPAIPADQQFRTINAAARAVVPGDRVFIYAGTYREHVFIERDGSADAPILFTAAPGAHVVVTGADPLTDWKRETPADSPERIYSTAWPHRFIAWSSTGTHPADDYHQLIGRSEQVIVDNYLMHQVLTREHLSRGSFYVDLDAKRLYLWPANNRELSERSGTRVEAAVRSEIWRSQGKHIHVKGITFRYCANQAQAGAVVLHGDGAVLEDCVVERTNSTGLNISRAVGVQLRRCVIRDNGQSGFTCSHAHDLQILDCIIERNNAKGFSRHWEAGGCKVVLSRGVVIEHSQFRANRGVGLWFDIGNERPIVRNCLLADNESAGLFYEISYGLVATDNVAIGNGFDADGGAWGAAAGISISSSPDCVIERNLLVANREGFCYREQLRTTPRLDLPKDTEVPVFNRNEVVRHNVITHNRDAAIAGWFDVKDQRHWPDALKSKDAQRAPEQDMARDYAATQPHLVAPRQLADLKLQHEGNLLFTIADAPLVLWGPRWQHHKLYRDLASVQRDLALEQGSEVADPGFADIAARDLRVPADSAAIRLNCYPRGEVPGVQLGTR